MTDIGDQIVEEVDVEEAEEEGIWMKVDNSYQDELLTKVLREPYEYNAPIVITPSHDEDEPQTSHYMQNFDDKDYLRRRHSHVNLHTPLKPLGTSSSHAHHSKKDKSRKSHKRHKHDRHDKERYPTSRSQDKQETVQTDTDTKPNEIIKEVSDVSTEISLEDIKDVSVEEIKEVNSLGETNIDIVDQRISVLPEIIEHVILSTPPRTHSYLSEQSEPVVDVGKQPDIKQHQKKPLNDIEGKDTPKGRSHKHRRHKHKSLRLEERQRPGPATLSEKNRVLTDPKLELGNEGDDIVLNLKDAEDMTFHRFQDLKGVHRRQVRVRRSGMVTHFSNQDLSASLRSLASQLRPALNKKKVYDHRPHDTFVELEELTTVGDETEWTERARWIKFEEDVEDSMRWGKPHIPSLSFHSLLELRRGLESGAVLLDLEQFDLANIAEAVIDEMIITDQIPRSQGSKVLSALLSKHRHQHQMQRGLPRRSSSTNLASFFNVDTKPTPMKPAELGVDHEPVKKDSVVVLNDKEVGGEAIPLEPLRTRTTSDASSQTPFSTLDYLAKAEERVGVSFAPEPVIEGENKDMENTTSDVRGRIPADAEATAVMVGTMDELEKPAMAFVRLAKGCQLGNLTELPLPVRFIFVLLGPPREDDQYREVGRSIATLMSDQIFHNLAYQAERKEDILSAINQFLSDSIVLAPGDWDERVLLPILEGHSQDVMRKRREAAAAAKRSPDEEDPLKRDGQLFAGLVKDVRRKYPHYLSDFMDGFKSFQCLVAFIFTYFAAIAPCITYGGLLSEKTDGFIGLSESILATALGGILFGLFSGQPLIIVGVTGPVLVFEETVYTFSKEFHIDYLVWRVWIGLWIIIICTIVIAFEGCFLVRYFTRFTEEIFSCLISFIFVYEAIKFLFQTFKEHPLGHTTPEDRVRNISVKEGTTITRSKHYNEPNTALLTTILLVGTVLLTMRLRKFRHSHFFGRKGRRTVSDFGMAISIIAMSLLSYSVREVYVQNIPELSGLKPTSPEQRGWLINPGDIHVAWMFAAVIPALFVSILLFMETELTGIVLNKKENNLKKGAGYNLDLLIVGLVCGLCSFMGLPWICAGPVRSVSHKNALSVMSTSHAPGERPHLVKIIEQRVTNIIIHIFIGFTVLMAPALKFIPLAVLFGVFVYLGTTSLSANQLVIRVVMFFMPSKHYPDLRFVRKVSGTKIHVFTLIQLVPLFILIGVKMTLVAPLFPLLIICLVPVRKQLYRLFDPRDLEELDNEELVYGQDLDEYNMVHISV